MRRLAFITFIMIWRQAMFVTIGFVAGLFYRRWPDAGVPIAIVTSVATFALIRAMWRERWYMP